LSGSSFEAAVEAYQRGAYQEAEKLCRSFLATCPDHAHSLHLAAAIALKSNEPDKALVYVNQALARVPEELNFLNTRGSILKSSGRLDEAKATYEKILDISPDHLDSMFNLANLLQQQGDMADAERWLLKVLAVNENYHPARLNLGFIYKGTGRVEEAEASFRALLEMGGGSVKALHGLGQTLFDGGKFEASESCFEQLVDLNPEDGDAWFFLGNSKHAQGKICEAEASHRRALTLLPEFSRAWNNLGNDLRDQGRQHDAIRCYREAIQHDPYYMRAHSNLLLELNCTLNDGAQLLKEHRHWNEMHVGKQWNYQPFIMDRDQQRRLRIGYVSSDFCHHSVAYFMAGILKHHDSDLFHVTCYSNLLKPDEKTEELHSYADRWQEIGRLSDDEAAGMIRKDAIDILVDLSGHTSHHRLLLFSRKPAPIQLTYLGYPATTGMSAMQYRITDAIADPAISDAWHSEDVVRLSRCFIAFTPDGITPDISEPPSLQDGFIRFVSFNHLAKVGPDVVRLWARVLQSVPDSRLLLKHFSMKDIKVRKRYLALFSSYGITEDRVECHNWASGREEHLGLYRQADIALDSFPYNGTTTTCEALWMGVPVITLAGTLHAGRVGATLLDSVGLSELVAGDDDAYVEIACKLASDGERLRQMRSGLRERMRASPLCDVKGMASVLENEYRVMWQRWCHFETELNEVGGQRKN